MPDGLTDIRAELLEAFDKIASAEDVWEFQRRLIAAIVDAEPVAFADKASPERRHLRLLRLFGDALAWRLLHSHTIRQLAKNQASPPAIHNQHGFRATAEIAETICRRGIPALIADLTYCLRVSDVIVCSDPEHPILIESGGHPRHEGRSRKGRQRRRAEAITKLLNVGDAVLEGDSHLTSTFEITTPADYTFASVAEAMQQFDGLTSWAMHSPGDVVLATSGENAEDFSPSPSAAEAIDAMSRPVVGINLGPLERPSPLLAPPHVWPLELSMRRALIESEIVLVHFVDLDAFVGAAASGRGALTEVRATGQSVRGFVVETHNMPSHVSPRLLDDVLYGFQSVLSARNQMVDFTASAIDALEHSHPTLGPRSFARVDTRAELDALVTRIEEGESRPAWITFAPEMGPNLTARDRRVLEIDALGASAPIRRD
ncbi:hypothetical protein [Baekduia sp. Peel2402]|uniref:hypothetical protein n=1 Tax=Baekduia sp. Peel2402 TaxID=3458296 RepID=UPI00403E8390